MGDEVTGAGLSAPGVFIPTPAAEPVKDRVPLPETSYLQVKLAELPPSSTVPAAEAGAAARVAPALPVAVIVGAARASSRTSAPPVLRMTRVKDTGFCPADALAGETDAETERAPGGCTAAPPAFCRVRTNETCCSPADTCLGDAVAVAASVPGACTSTTGAAAAGGLTAVPLLPSVPLAVAAKASVPLPETSYCQENVCDAPPGSTVPPVDGGMLASAAAADPLVRTGGG